ncbi:MAG: hypothetical protein GPJ52_00780 [Candidatus Heimdallarchaeota archaeon]|nr:hypothetical protein [Candidatus Heimdallarchaeota archaeon]
MPSEKKSVIQSKAVESGLEGMQRFGQQFSSGALVAAQKTHKYLDLKQGLQDRTMERGTFKIEVENGYDLSREIITIKDGLVQKMNGNWVPFSTGLDISRKKIQRSIEIETNENLAKMEMLDKLAVTTIIESSRAASKKAKKKKIAKIEKVLKLLGELSEE